MSHPPVPPPPPDHTDAGRRSFLKGAALAAGASLVLPSAPASADPRPLTDAEKVTRLASNTYPIRDLFKRRPDPTATPEQVQTALAMKKKYREITMLDFPQFTIDTFPGVRKMDLWSALFGDVSDDAMYRKTTREYGPGDWYEFDPSTTASKRWLDTFASRLVTTGVACHHVSNNAPRNISHLDPALRREGIAIAKIWLDACATLGAKSMRVNTGGPDIAPGATNTTGFPRNDEVVKYLRNAIESFKEMADYGGKVGVKVTIENHWGISADPMNMRIIFDEVNHPYCEASPDFGNWEHEYMLHHGLHALMPYTHTTVHAKYWSRWDTLDIARCVRILNSAGYKGAIALEYEAGPWDGVEGATRLMKDVLAAL
ncbi:TIM barrel protein [Luteitalea sp.]|uniref:sugar phosphate isomerase/epimerase family protein n=1 Tax=Luteitalea sp. TaxID=2004800 RepID=UPI0025BF12FE|nr:TIM barrel protein [Luteitalea sp.]